MENLKTLVLVLDLICAALLTVTILFQSGKSAGLSGAIAGASDSFMSKGGSKTLDAKLGTATKVLGIAFVTLSLLTVILVSSVKTTASAATPETTAPVTTAEAAAQTTGEAATEAATTGAVETTTETAG